MPTQATVDVVESKCAIARVGMSRDAMTSLMPMHASSAN
jgi:hypothetical protein